MDNRARSTIVLEAEERLKSLKDTSARRREWYQDLKIRIADRQIDHISLISSISAAIVALTVSFTSEKNILVNFSFWSLILTVILGTLLVLLLIFHNKRVVEDDRNVELSTLDRLKESTKQVILYPENYATHINDFEREYKMIEHLSDKYKGMVNFLNFLFVAVLALFLTGILTLVGVWIDIKEYNVNVMTLLAIAAVSLVLGAIKYGSLTNSYKGQSWQLKFIEIWNDFINFLIAGLIGYYFVLVKWPLLRNGEALNTGDFILFIIFALGMFGHLCVISKNITDGVEEILRRIKRKIA